MRSIDSGRRGNQGVEVTLIVPLLLALGVGVCDYGWYFVNNLAISSAVRDGTDHGAAYARRAAPSNPCEVGKKAVALAIARTAVSGAVTGSVHTESDGTTLYLVTDVQIPDSGLFHLLPTPALQASVGSPIVDQGWDPRSYACEVSF